MAFDEEQIRITVDGAQAQAQLDALAKEVRELEAELKMLNSTAGITDAEINSVNRQLGDARERFSAAQVKVAEFGKSAQVAGFNVKDMTKSLGAGISIISILQQNLRDLEPVLKDAGEAMKFAAEQGGASAETMDNLGRALDSLLHPSRIAKNAIESVGIAWKKMIDEMVPPSTVAVHNVKTVEESLKALDEARKAAAKATEQTAEDEAKALEDVAKAEAALEESTLKASEARIAATEKAAAAVVAALEKERVALDAKLAQDEARLAASLAKGSKLDTSGESDEARQELSALKKSIKDVENQPLISVDQLNALNEMKDRAGLLSTELTQMSKVFTITRDDFLDDEQSAKAAAAAWDVYGDMLDQAQNRHNAAMDGIDGTTGALDGMVDSADDAGESLEDAADAAGELGDEAKKGADKAKEGLAGLKEGAEEAIPLLETIKGLLAEIKQAASEVDL